MANTAPTTHDFTGKTVIVTGSSIGIGEGIARRFADAGANVVLNSRSGDDLEKVAADMDDARILIVPGDVSSADFAKQIVSNAEVMIDTEKVTSQLSRQHRRRNVKPDTTEFPNYLPAKKLAK